jgi:hypothetical protein
MELEEEKGGQEARKEEQGEDMKEGKGMWEGGGFEPRTFCTHRMN